MLRRLRRPAALVAPLVVLSGLLAACGSDVPGSGLEFADRLEAVTVDGEVGAAPTVTWKQRMSAGAIEAETLIEGDGAPIADGDDVFVNFLLADGFTRSTAVDTFGAETAGIRLTVGADAAEPQVFNDLVASVLGEQVKAGLTRGSRLVVTGDTPAIFGELALSPVVAMEGIGNEDGLLLVADVLDVEQLPAPEGEQSTPPGWAPKILFGDAGIPTGFDFEGLAKPEKTLLAATLKKGTGDTVEKGDLLVADYVGQVYDADAAFDESYSKDKEPIATPIGLGQVVNGWDEKLVGMTVGSRVLLRIPPADGYGAQGQGDTIPPGSTLYFVVDILASI